MNQTQSTSERLTSQRRRADRSVIERTGIAAALLVAAGLANAVGTDAWALLKAMVALLN